MAKHLVDTDKSVLLAKVDARRLLAYLDGDIPRKDEVLCLIIAHLRNKTE